MYQMAELYEDNGACLFLQWFIREQEQSEADFRTWIDRLDVIEGDGAGLLAMDKEFAKKYGE